MAEIMSSRSAVSDCISEIEERHQIAEIAERVSLQLEQDSDSFAWQADRNQITLVDALSIPSLSPSLSFIRINPSIQQEKRKS